MSLYTELVIKDVDVCAGETGDLLIGDLKETFMGVPLSERIDKYVVTGPLRHSLHPGPHGPLFIDSIQLSLYAWMCEALLHRVADVANGPWVNHKGLTGLAMFLARIVANRQTAIAQNIKISAFILHVDLGMKTDGGKQYDIIMVPEDAKLRAKITETYLVLI